MTEQQKRANENNRNRSKPARVLEIEKREEGLSSAISKSNKGFAMLEKMGYDPSKGLGRSGEGRMEPVPVTIKCDRTGLGRETALKEYQAKKLAIQARRLKANIGEGISEFRARMQNQKVQRLIFSDLTKSQRVCQHLDQEKGMEQPDEVWFWPEEVPEDAEEEETVVKKPKKETPEEEETLVEEDIFEPAEKLEMLTNYLRISHLYCLWCGTKFQNEEDLATNCPGTTRDDHWITNTEINH